MTKVLLSVPACAGADESAAQPEPMIRASDQHADQHRCCAKIWRRARGNVLAAVPQTQSSRDEVDPIEGGDQPTHEQQRGAQRPAALGAPHLQHGRRQHQYACEPGDPGPSPGLSLQEYRAGPNNARDERDRKARRAHDHCRCANRPNALIADHEHAKRQGNEWPGVRLPIRQPPQLEKHELRPLAHHVQPVRVHDTKQVQASIAAPLPPPKPCRVRPRWPPAHPASSPGCSRAGSTTTSTIGRAIKACMHKATGSESEARVFPAVDV